MSASTKRKRSSPTWWTGSVEAGEVTITKHGKAVAKLVPARARRAESERAEVIREILEFGKTV